MKYMLDTNICIYIIKKKYQNIVDKFNQVRNSEICISSITYSELMYGVEKSLYKERNLIALLKFLSNIEILEYGENASINYGIIRAQLEKKGKVIGPLDMLIAGHALSLDATLVTNNTREFKRIENLKLVDWSTKK